MKILHICEYVRGGITTYISEILKYQVNSKQVNSVSLLMSDYNSDRISINGVNVYYYKYRRNPTKFISAAIQINRVINQLDPDIIHIHSSFAGLFVRICYFFKKNRPKIVYCAHGWAFSMDVSYGKKKLYGFIEKLLSTKTDVIINISRNEFVESQKYNIPKKKSVIIQNGIDEKYHKQGNVSLFLDKSKINLLFVGRFDKQKGIDILINFFENNYLENIKLYTIGKSVLETAEMNIPDSIVCLGWIDNSVIDSYYEKFDAVIIPSRWEGFGLVAIEAMKNKKPIIASNRGALPDLIKNDVNGYLFDIGKTEELKKILSNINKQQLKVMGENGYNIYKTKFTSNKLNEQLINVYVALINSKSYPITKKSYYY